VQRHERFGLAAPTLYFVSGLPHCVVRVLPVGETAPLRSSSETAYAPKAPLRRLTALEQMDVLRVTHARDVVPVALDDDRLVGEQDVDFRAKEECQQERAAEV
jgi:hypothetical protein